MACLHESLTCLIHLETVVNESIKLFTDKTWNTLHDCVEIWCKLDGKQRELVESLSQVVKFDSEILPLDFGYHPTCYSRFIDKRNICRAERRSASRQSNRPNAVDDEYVRRSPAAKLLRSKSGLPIRSSSNPVLPAVCVICNTVDRYVTLQHKRVKDKLVKAETTTAGRLTKAAQLRSDEGIVTYVMIFLIGMVEYSIGSIGTIPVSIQPSTVQLHGKSRPPSCPEIPEIAIMS